MTNFFVALQMSTGWNIGAKDATDDRLADLLSMIGSSQEQKREQIALRLGQQTIRAYELPTDKARSDTTSFSVYHQPETETEGENLLNFGYSKDRRPDLVQYRQMLATLDPMGLPYVMGISARSHFFSLTFLLYGDRELKTS